MFRSRANPVTVYFRFQTVPLTELSPQGPATYPPINLYSNLNVMRTNKEHFSLWHGYNSRAPLSSAVASGTSPRYNAQEYKQTSEVHHPQPTQRGEMRLQPEIAMKDDRARRRRIGIQSEAS
jgi:hypothetical protein